MVDRSYLRLGGRPERGVQILTGLFVAGLLVFVFWGSPLYADTLGLVPAKAFRDWHLWRVFTAPLWVGSLAQVRITTFVLGLLALWLLGTPLERWLGPRRFLILFAASAVVGHLGAALVGLAVAPAEALGGMGPGVWGVVAAICVNYWNLQVLVVRPLPVRGRHICYALGVCLAVAALVDWKDGLPLLPFLADALGALVGTLFVTRAWRLWRRSPRPRARFVVLPGGQDVAPRRSGRGGNGRAHPPSGRPPKTWN